MGRIHQRSLRIVYVSFGGASGSAMCSLSVAGFCPNPSSTSLTASQNF